MNINKRRTKRKILYTFAALLIAGAAYAAYIYLRPENTSKISSDGTNYGTPSKGQVDTGEQAKLNTIENDQKAKTEGTDATSTSFTTQLTANNINSGVLQIRNSISGVHSSGTCILTLSQNGRVVVRSASIQPLPQTSTCQGFDIPVSQLASGTWQINLKVTIGDKTTQASGSVKV